MSAVVTLVAHFELFVLVLCRTTGIFLAAPVFSSPVIPRLVKALLAGVVAACLLPVAVAHQGGATIPVTWMGFAAVAAKEILVGLVLGFFALLAYTAVQVGGELLSEQMGFAMSKVADPTVDAEMAVVARLATVLGLLLFLGIDGHHWLLMALVRSFAKVPVGGMGLSEVTMGRLVDGFAATFESGVVLAAPVLCVTILVTVAIGVVARLVPQIHALMLAFPLKIGVGLLMLGLALPFIAHAAEKHFVAMGRSLVPLLSGS
ncbi:MAG: flagellar biosynthetic protein FliR [bacterium]